MRPLTLLRAKPVAAGPEPAAAALDARRCWRGTASREVMINLHHLPGTVRRGGGRRARLRPARCAIRTSATILGTGGGPRKVRALLRRRAVPPRERRRGLRLRPARPGRAAPRAPGARATLALQPNPDPRRYRAVVTGRGGRRARRCAGLPRPARGHGRRCSPASTCSIPRCSTACAAGPSDTVRDLYAPLVAEGERRARGAHAGPRGTISAARRCTSPPSCALLSPRLRRRAGAALLVHPEARVASAARG